DDMMQPNPVSPEDEASTGSVVGSLAPTGPAATWSSAHSPAGRAGGTRAGRRRSGAAQLARGARGRAGRTGLARAAPLSPPRPAPPQNPRRPAGPPSGALESPSAGPRDLRPPKRPPPGAPAPKPGGPPGGFMPPGEFSPPAPRARARVIDVLIKVWSVPGKLA